MLAPHSTEHPPTIEPTPKPSFSWLRFCVSIILTIGALWIVSRDIAWRDVGDAVFAAKIGYVALALTVILVTTLIKSWRWRLLFNPFDGGRTPAGSDLFWSILVGQYVNLFVWRVGDLSRVYDLHRRSGFSKTRILSTLVVEKLLELLFLAILLLAVLPFVVVPDIIRNPAVTVSSVAIPALFILYLFAYQTEWIIAIVKRIASWLPDFVASRMIQLVVTGLEGVTALRSRKAVGALIGYSTVLLLLYIATPFLLILAFDFPFGLREAVLLHLITAIGNVPPSTPARIGVFEWLVIFMLTQFGLADENSMLSYALLYHAIVLLPQIILGAVAMSRSRGVDNKLAHD